MVPMPYILVNMVADLLSLILFCVTTAALLSKYRLISRYLPAQLQNHKKLVFVAHVLALAALAILVVRVVPRGNEAFATARLIFELFFYVGFANAVVLTFQFLDRRYLLGMPNVQRRLLIALGAVLVPSAGVIAVANVVVLLFTIR